jgi:hypothetical protein
MEFGKAILRENPSTLAADAIRFLQVTFWRMSAKSRQLASALSE